MNDESADEDPGPVEVERVEGSRKNIVQLNVEYPGGKLEQHAAHQQKYREPLQRMADRFHRRPGKQLGDHRPELREKHRNQYDAECHVDTLRKPIEPVRIRRPGEQVEPQPASVRGPVIGSQVRVVRRVREQSGDEHQRNAHQQHRAEHGRQPRPTERAAPESRPCRTERRPVPQQPHQTHPR